MALDWMDGAWRLGTFGGRIRWDAAAHFLNVVPQPKREDVSLFWGVRGGLDLWGWVVTTELTHGVRLNYLFQTFWADDVTGRAEGVDIANTTLSLTLSKLTTR
jgi:hypothetical protein